MPKRVTIESGQSPPTASEQLQSDTQLKTEMIKAIKWVLGIFSFGIVVMFMIGGDMTRITIMIQVISPAFYGMIGYVIGNKFGSKN
jgi:hypothetical protein